MDINTINQIRDSRDSIRKKIKSLNLNNYGSSTYGTENEYSFKGVIAGIEALLTDISTLTRYPKKFVKISTFNERKTIHSNLERIDTYLTSPENYLTQFESLKTLIRAYNVRNISDRQLEFEKEVEEVRKIKIQLQQILTETKELKEQIDESNQSIKISKENSSERLTEIESELEKITEQKNDLIGQSENLESINTNLEEIKENASNKLQEVTGLLNESKSNEKLISSFANKVQNRDNRLSELEQSIEQNNDKLIEYEKERKSILDEANKLIDSAKKALNYKTAEGISASFQSQYSKANNIIILILWISAATICLGVTVALGVWILQTAPDQIGLLIARVSLLPLPIVGAVFCANQYTKQKNIIEDYAYKMVLSKAIVGFSEQLKRNGSETNEEYIHYIKTALEEIHKDPLRKRDNKKQKDPNLKDLVEIAERIIKMSKIE